MGKEIFREADNIYIELDKFMINHTHNTENELKEFRIKEIVNGISALQKEISRFNKCCELNDFSISEDEKEFYKKKCCLMLLSLAMNTI